MSRADVIERKLRKNLDATFVEVVNESGLHRGHLPGHHDESHFAVTVVSPLFEGKSRLERHRLVYACMGSELASGLHALRILAFSPAEKRR